MLSRGSPTPVTRIGPTKLIRSTGFDPIEGATNHVGPQPTAIQVCHAAVGRINPPNFWPCNPVWVWVTQSPELISYACHGQDVLNLHLPRKNKKLISKAYNQSVDNTRPSTFISSQPSNFHFYNTVSTLLQVLIINYFQNNFFDLTLFS